jgi:hypothetical protein
VVLLKLQRTIRKWIILPPDVGQIIQSITAWAYARSVDIR